MPIRPLESTALRLVRGPSSAPALVSGQTAIDHGELRDRVDTRRHELGSERRLVMIAAANEIEPIVTYLAALEGGHPVLFVDGDPASNRQHREALIERFDPDVIADGRDAATRWALTERRDGTRHELHPELALLASTSGSTGSPKLVRLSRANVESNAVAIADYLNLGVADRAVTTLPLHYCYGLSVVNSHLVAGGSIALQSNSVVDDEFWRVFDDVQATSFAGVPYTFDLLDAAGFAERSTPSLRYVTQAGGRLDPERVRSYARLGRDRGFEFVVMYGQTEATARMAYLPPNLAESAAGAIGVPIPGGRFRIDDPRDDGVGELVYSGPNVMLGYAEEPADFASGRVIDELRTGDLARRRDDGLYEVVGRSSRFVKVFGLRIDLDRVEQLLADDGFEVRTASSDERLLLFVRAERLVDAVRERTAAHTGLPAHAIRVHAIDEFPRTSSGKPDTAALVRYAADLDACAERAACAERSATADGMHDAAASDTGSDAVRLLYTALLGRSDVTLDDSFSGLGGDSLSYVEVSLRLEALLGALPREWPTMTVRELGAVAAVDREEPESAIAGTGTGTGTGTGAAATPAAPATVSIRSAPRRRLPRVETPAVLRAVAILLIVGTHANLFDVKGGAHLLLAVAGYNLARFQLADVEGRSRSRSLLRSTGQLLVPAVLWVGAVALVSGYYPPETVLFVNNFGGESTWSVHWQFWFIEAVAWSLLGLAALLAVPGIDRLERRHPYAFAVGVLAVALVARTLLLGGVEAHATERYTTAIVVWCLALGWLIARSRSLTQRWVATAVAIASVAGFFGTPSRELVIVIGLLLLIWLPAVPLPRLFVPVVGVLAGASMFIYLTHWQVYPSLENHVPWLATLLSLVVGVVAWKLYALASSRLTAMGRARRRRRRAPRP